ncbi:MAG: hypothetical protein KF905_08425 [Flavobacteriales bacterium]|nr:hypothetical protein [Flavobacteriales bacterium]
MRKIILLSIAVSFHSALSAQNVGINADGAAPAASAMLDVDVSALPAANKRGLLVPRIALTAANVAAPVVTPAVSLLVYNTATAGAGVNAVSPGYYYWNGTVWVRFANSTDAWTTLGNAGTVAGTNFIGTTDAVDWVIKTGGSAAANERMRVLSSGKVVVNNTGVGAFTNDVFSVYANGTTNGTTTNISAQGLRAINGYTSSGFGVAGFASGTTGTSFGVYGAANATTGTANAIRGESTAPNSTAVVGISNVGAGALNTATTGHGVFGQINGTLNGTAVGFGVRGLINATMTTGDARGVQGASPSDNGTGVIGFATSAATTGNSVGTWGQAASSTGFGMRAVNTNATGTGLVVTGNNAATTYLVNGSGTAINGSGIGDFAIARTAASGVGVVGVGNNLVGSIITPAQGCGVAGTGVRYGVMGFATTTVTTNSANNSAANALAASAGGYFEVQAAGTAQTWSYVAVREAAGAAGLRKIIGPGTVNTIVHAPSGERVALSCPEAPENLFQDYGSGQLRNGRAQITLDPILAFNILVDDTHPLRVFVQLEGDCNGVYVTNKSGTGFDVVELAGGTSNVPFTYTVVANRADEVNPDGTISRYSVERFPPAPGPQETIVQAAREERSVRPVVDGALEPIAKP